MKILSANRMMNYALRNREICIGSYGWLEDFSKRIQVFEKMYTDWYLN